MSKLEVIGVVGAGVMGTGLGQALAQVGYRVLLVDVKNEILESARDAIFNGVRLQAMLARSEPKLVPADVLARIQFSTDYEVFAGADFVIENVVEQWQVKSAVYAKLDQVCPERCVFAANTSAISITKIASRTQRPARVLGMHFMNPVPLKPAVEVIRGVHTSDATLELAQQLLAKMGKRGIVVNDAPGFVSNRVLMLTINEAIYLLHEGVASAEDVDAIFKSCFGHKMGPLETADLIGLDTILLSIEVLYESFNDSKYRPCPLLKKLVDAGYHGRKNGRGFYEYA